MPPTPPLEDPATLMGALNHAAATAATAKKKAQRAQDRFEDQVAATVSARPLDPAWWAYPGALTQDQTMAAAGLTPTAMQRLMERHAGRAKRKAARRG